MGGGPKTAKCGTVLKVPESQPPIRVLLVRGRGGHPSLCQEIVAPWGTGAGALLPLPGRPGVEEQGWEAGTPGRKGGGVASGNVGWQLLGSMCVKEKHL